MKVKCYDNGGDTYDRYTVLYGDHPEKNGTYAGRGMSSSPFHPLGFGMYITGSPGPHLGKRIKFKDLPLDCQKLVLQDLK